MSFYGSTYFQLIDTFYKILVKNSSKSTETLKEAPSSANELPTQASGRKGVLQFAIGNRWLVAEQDSSNTNSYKIYHGKPGGPTITDRTPSFVEASDEEVNKTSDGKYTVTSLKSGDIIKIPAISYDKAGHISASSNKYFQIPITETETAIRDLQNKVGEPQDSKNKDLFTRAKEADDAITSVTNTANRIRDELGTYAKVFPSTGASKYVNNTNQYKDFFATFGSMDAFRNALYEDETSSKSLIDGILEFREKTLTDIGNNSDNIGTQARLTNELTDNLTDAKNDIKALQAKDKTIDQNINVLSTNLTDTATAIRKEFKDADDVIKGSIETCNERIGDLSSTVSSNKTNLENSINNLSSTVNTNKANCNNRMKSIEENATRLEGVINDNVTQLAGSIETHSNDLKKLIQKNTDGLADLSDDVNTLGQIVETNKAAAEEAAGSLSTRVTNLENNSASKEELNAESNRIGQNATEIEALSGRVDELNTNTSNSISGINATIAQLNNVVAGKADGSALDLKADKTTIIDLQDSINKKADASSVTALEEQVAQKANQSKVDELASTKADQVSLDDLAATVDTKAGLDLVEKYAALDTERFSKLEAENLELRGLIEELTARVAALEKGPTT